VENRDGQQRSVPRRSWWKVASFFRFPDLQHSPGSLEHLANRNIAVFSTDIDSRDFAMHKPARVINSVMSQLERRGKGIVLMHDFHRNTAEALPELIRQLKPRSPSDQTFHRI
jgi:peptidoglycan/xylan/chitin deacetylase (PgdA/CDA1 family)